MSKECAVKGLTKRGQAVAAKKTDVNEKWYEKYISKEFYENKEFLENWIRDIENNTDKYDGLYAPEIEYASLKKDSAEQRIINMRIARARKDAEKLIQENKNDEQKGDKEMKFDVVGSNPIIMKQEDGLYTVIYALPPAWKIEKKVNLTYQEAAALPYVTDYMMRFVK